MAELRNFAKAPKKRDPSSSRGAQEKTSNPKTSILNKETSGKNNESSINIGDLQGKTEEMPALLNPQASSQDDVRYETMTKDNQMSEASISQPAKIKRPNLDVDQTNRNLRNLPKQLTSQLLNLSSSNISQELKHSCSNIVALGSFKSSSSEKEFLLRRLQELITKEERQVKVDIEARAEGLRRQRKRQAVERSDLERRHEAEMLLMANNQASEKKNLDTTFADKSEFLKNELHLLEEELRSITAPVEMLSSLITSSPSSVPLSVASSIATPDTGDIIDDMREELECCGCGVVCYPPAVILQCPDGDILCQSCSEVREACPQCGVTLAGRLSRNKVLENIANNFYANE